MDVGRFLREFGLERYEPAFRENKIDSEILPKLTAEDLKDLGIALVGDRRRLLDAIASLHAEVQTPATETPHVAEAAIGRGSPIAEAERRQLTVMFVDLVGSTELSRRLDPEEMREVIRAYQNTVAGEIGLFDGHVAKFMGDGVLAYFGWPHGHEDDAERSVRAALAIVDTVARLATPAGKALAARIGIATGLVIVGDLIGEGVAREAAVVGETPNLAARLQALAEPGSVIIATGTRTLIGGLFDLADLGTHSFKGYSEPVRAWRVVREGSAESRFEAMHGGTLTPLIGREHEIGLLLERFERARDGDGQVVLLSGEPGIGKSRTVGTLRERLAGEHCLPLSHFCSPFHINSALYPIIGLLERAAGFERDDPPAGRLAKLEALVARAIKDVGESAPLLAALLSIPTGDRYPPLELTPEVQKQRTLKVLLDHLIGLAAQQPVLAVYEDVHWVDPSTLELLGQLIEGIERLPILVVITFRPEFTPPWLSHGNITPLPLGRLARRQGASMIEAVAGGKTLPPEVLDQIVARTDGVPLFVEELTKTLIESGLLQEAGDRYTLNGSLSSLAVPTTLHDSLLARLDRLGAAKETAQLGAALGREFSHELLAAVSPLGDAKLQELLAQLSNAGLLFQRGSPPDATYTFKHALVRDAAYASLLKSRRQQIHSRIAQALKDKFSERVAAAPELLAHHYGEAGLTELAVQYWERAGTRALERSAIIEAVAHYRTGLPLFEGLPEGVRSERELPIQIGLGSALASVKGYANPETGAAYERARELCLEIGEKQRLFPVLYGLWSFELVAARHIKGKQIANQFVELAEQHGELGPLVAAYSALGSTFAYMGSWPDGNQTLEKCITLYDPESHANLKFECADDPCVQANLASALCLWNLGYPDRALMAMDRAVNFAERLQHANSKGYALAVLPMLHYFIENPTATAVAAEACIKFCSETRLPGWEAFPKVWRGWALSHLGHAVQGVAELQEGMEGWYATGSKIISSGFFAALGDAYRMAGNHDEAWRAIESGLRFAEGHAEGFREAELHRLKGLILLSQDNEDLTGAEEHFARALEVARDQQSRSMELRIATDLAGLWQRHGKTGEARELLAPIYNWFTEGFNTPALKNAKALLDSLD